MDFGTETAFNIQVSSHVSSIKRIVSSIFFASIHIFQGNPSIDDMVYLVSISSHPKPLTHPQLSLTISYSREETRMAVQQRG